MGNWNITIVGVGAHNSNKEEDADQLFKKFVEEMRTKGQGISHASITYGGAEYDSKSKQLAE